MIKDILLYFNDDTYKNIIKVASVILLIKIFALAKEIYIGSLFGLSETLDAFYILILIPSFIQSVFIGAFKAVFIPNYIRASNENKECFYNNLIFLTLLFSFVLILLLLLISNPINNILVQKYPSSISHTVLSYQYVFLICIPIWSFTALISGFLEINDRFISSAIYPIFNSLSIIPMLYYRGATIENLILGTIIGSFIGFVYLFSRFPIWLNLKKINFTLSETITLCKQFPQKLLSGLIFGVNPFIDQFFTSQLAGGAIALLQYGNKFPAFAISILSVSIGNVLLPYFSKLHSKDPRLILNQLKQKMLFVFSIGTFCTVFLLIFGYDLIVLFFEKGSFTNLDSRNASNVLFMFSFQIPFYLTDMILVRFLTAFNLNKFNIVSSLISVFINIICNYILIEKYGVAGIALSTSIVLFVSFLSRYIYIYIKFAKRIS